MRNKGFTLVELMVVVLIVGILAAVAIPMMRGRIDAAKWSEGKAGAGTIATAVRAYAAENGAFGSKTLVLTTDLGFANADLEGTYFPQSSYDAKLVSYDPNSGLDATITVTAPSGMTPTSMQLVITNGKSAWK